MNKVWWARLRVQRRWWRTAIALAVGMATILAGATTAYAGDTPSGYYYGTDGSNPTSGSPAPYTEPGNCGGFFGGYVLEVGNSQLITQSNPTGYTPGHGYG